MVMHVPLDLIRIAIPLAIYFVVMLFAVFLPEDGRATYGRTTAAAFTAASYAIAVAVAAFGWRFAGRVFDGDRGRSSKFWF
jgi:arsenite transporter